MGVETLAPLDHNVHYRQALMPNHQKGTFLGDDTDNHDFLFKGMGKSKIGISIDNPPDQILTWTLYGMHEVDGEVGDAGTFQIDTDTVPLADKSDEGFIGWNAPFFLLRCAFAVSPTDTPKKTVSVYIDETI